MTDPVVWLGASLLLVAASLALLMVAALPAIQEIASAARSAEKLFDILSRELPPTLESIRLTGSEIAGLTEDVSQNVQAAGRVVGQFDQSLSGIRQQAQQAQVTTRSLGVGVKAAWQSLTRPRAEFYRPEQPNPEQHPAPEVTSLDQTHRSPHPAGQVSRHLDPLAELTKPQVEPR